MILNAIILILLIGGFINGYRNGVLRQLIITIGYLLSFFVAYKYYEALAPHITFIPYPELEKSNDLYAVLDALHTEDAYYNSIAFLMIFLVAVIVVHMIASLFKGVTKVPVLRQVNGLIGAVLGVLQTYLVLFLLLYVGAIFPAEWAQNAITGSSVAEWILENTPILSESFYKWMTGILPK
ncbi:CvpA family protein [Listeria grandensis]|uniref:CvpA family membrane protein n=2 Tax=Listeria grandensis TaxID=1494963 RepID=W7BIT9_9LIST|nr:CvpA family protein [Listeria grandensis]EUJ24690.1 CvpA family membrane protein [Listeria grandensis FSL F6-0971]MBC1473232.1 CvpA family protein [Listeria grandensis]MBC1935262.1 CvpA family protein [Listeria grandensis]MBC6314739.1 CvpA family protein [Listeria grandensis]